MNKLQNKTASSITLEINIACEEWPGLNHLDGLIHASINAAMRAANCTVPANAELSLLFSNDDALCKLNQRFRDICNPTNVLSFPFKQIKVGEVTDTMLGDIAFAYQTIARESKQLDIGFDRHLSHLIIHGFLHIFGYDHENDADARTMETVEISALASLGIDNPYREV